MRKIYKVLFTSLFAFMMLFSTNTINAWDGVIEEQPQVEGTTYLISKAEELKWFSSQVNAGERVDAKLVADIDLESQGWISIGTTSNPFTGSFDGDNHKISNYYTSGAGAWVSGLFGKSQGTIKNLSLSGEINAAGNGAGTIVGWNDGGIVSNVYSDVMISYASSARTNGAGIVGQNSNSGKVMNSIYAGTINGFTETGGTRQVAGIVGTNQNSSVIGCINKGKIIGANGTLASAVGGIVSTASLSGVSKNYIYNNINLGEVVAESSNGKVAGIVSTGSAISSNGGSEFIIINNLNLVTLDSPIINTQPNTDYATNHITNNYYLSNETDYDNGTISADDLKSETAITKLNSNDGSDYEIDISEEIKFVATNEYPTLVYANKNIEPGKEDLEYVQAAKKAIENSWFKLIPKHGEDTNVNDVIKNKLIELNYGDLNISVKSSADENYIGSNGNISYFYADPNSSTGMWFKQVKTVFELDKNGAKEEYSLNAVIHWDVDKLKATTKTEITDKIDEENIKNENTDLTNVTSDLSLTKVVDNKKWATTTWISSDTDVITIDNSQESSSSTMWNPFIGKIKRSYEDKTVTLTSTTTNNLTSTGQPDVKITKTFDVVVKGIGASLGGEMQEKLDNNYTIDKLKEFGTNNIINKDSITTDIQLLTPKNTGISDYDSYKFSATTLDETNATINGYRVSIYRPLPNNEAKEVTITITMKHKNYDVSVSKDIVLTIEPLKQADIDKEITLMEKVKASYFDGIKGSNTSKDNIESDLKAFRQASYADDNSSLQWSYNINDDKVNAIKAVSIDESMPSEQWNLFKSSNNSVIEHEVLRVNTPKNDTKVTITSCLSSEEYAKYTLKYPDNEDFKKLYRQAIDVDLTVIGSEGGAVESTPQTATVNVKIEGVDNTLMDTTKVTVSPKDISSIVGGSSDDWINTPDLKPVGMHALVAALEANGHDVSDKNIFNAGYGAYGSYINSILGLEAQGNSGWMFVINNGGFNNGLDKLTLNDNDSITLYYLKDYEVQSYGYFDKDKVETYANENIDLNLNQLLYDENYNMYSQPVENAKLVIEQLQDNGTYLKTVKDDITSNSEGKLSFSLDKAGTYYITSHLGNNELNQLTRASVKVVVKSKLAEQVIEKANNIDKNKYSSTSVKNLENAKKELEKLVNSGNYTEKQMNAAIAKVESAIKGLSLSPTKVVVKGSCTYSYKLNSAKKYILTKSVCKKGTKTTSIWYKAVAKKNKAYKKEILTKKVKTYANNVTYYSNGKTKINAKYYKSTKSKWTKKTKLRYKSNGKKSKYVVFNYKNGKASKRTEYLYNKAGQLKTNKYGKAYRYTTTYKKGKAKKTYRITYNKKGKATKKISVKKRVTF